MASGPEKVLGEISAMQTLIKNFPMSILDYAHMKTYTSVYDFILDLLAACGVDIKEIEERLISEFFDVGVDITEESRSVHERIEEMNFDEDQSKFFQALEVSVKSILMGALSSIFTCSSIPMVPRNRFNNVDSQLWYDIPVGLIDYWNMLRVCPSSEEGPMYYDVRTKSAYYKLARYENDTPYTEDETFVYTPVPVYGEIETDTTHKAYLADPENRYDYIWFYLKSAVTEDVKVTVEYYDEVTIKNITLKTFKGNFKFDRPYKKKETEEYEGAKVQYTGVEDPKCPFTDDAELREAISGLSAGVYNATVVAAHGGTDPYNEALGERRVKAMNAYASKFNTGVTFNYINGGRDDSSDVAKVTIDKVDEIVTTKTEIKEHVFTTIIRAGETKSEDALEIKYLRGYSPCSFVTKMYLNDGDSNVVIDGKNVYISYEDMIQSNMYKAWDEGGNYSWHKTLENNFYGEKNISGTTQVEKIDVSYSYGYELLKSKYEMGDGTAVTMKYVPTNPDANSPLYICVPQGSLKVYELYKAYDLNALIWYTINKGSNNPIYEYNKMMWDTRWPAAKQGIERSVARQWNQWYNSKTKITGDFTISAITEYKEYSDDDRILYPIIQLKNDGKKSISVNFPFQSFKDENEKISMKGASLYRYNWDYLQSIKIFKPRIILHRMVEELLGVRLSPSLSLTLDQKVTEAKIRNLILNIVEADDTEVSDCYKTFSNDDFNEALESMILEKYRNSTSETKTYTASEYLSKIDEINPSSTDEGSTTKITKMVNEIATTPSSPETISYGLNLTANYNHSILKDLLMAITMPIIECIFSPQLMLLIMVNLSIMGVVSAEDITGGGQSAKIVNLLVNKVFALLKEVIKYVKDKIAELLMKLFYEYVTPLLEKYTALIVSERLAAWLILLKEALNCVTLYSFKRSKVLTEIDDVNYADIVKDETTPESSSEC